MSNLVPPPSEPEDLSVLLRRGHASRADEDALAQRLREDATLRIGHRVGLDLDRESSVRAGDEQLILRAADAALRASSPDSRGEAPLSQWRFLRARKTWQLAAAAALALILSGTGVGAALWVAGINPWPMLERTVIAGTAPVRRAAKKVRRTPARATPSAVSSDQHVAEAASLAAPEIPVIEGSPVVVPVVPVPRAEHGASHSSLARPRERFDVDPAELFREAGAARRAGELARATRLYGKLLREAPTADEAHVARVSLGKLLFTQGQYARAEHEFRRYLEAGGGPLSEEALFNRAECLGKLGRGSEEKLAWRALLSAYPGSLYAAHAKQRLDAIELSSSAAR
jgi:TolA-binding protein